MAKKISKKFLVETIKRLLEQEEQPASGGFPGKAPKEMPLSDGAGPKPDEVVAKLAAMADGAPNDAKKELEKIGGAEVLKKNYLLLAKQFKGAANNPDRIKMPVVDPDKSDPDIADDGGDLGKRLKKGALDLKPPYADIDLGGHKAKEAGAANRKDQIKITRSEALVRKIAKIVVERMNNLQEQDLDDVHPQGLNKMPKQVRADYLTKGLKDGDNADDSAVTLTKAEIPVGKARPSQKQVYIDKSLWNILKFTGTDPGGTAHGDANMIAIDVGGEYVILDGHHRWSSAFLSGGPSAKVRVQVLKGLNTAESIAALRAYGNARGNKQKG
jgi:hypothetical protein